MNKLISIFAALLNRLSKPNCSSNILSWGKRMGAFVVVLLLTCLNSFGQSQTYTSGTGSFTVPAGVTSIKVECWGAGGGGGNSNNISTNGGSGGGGGAYSTSTLTVSQGSYYYNVGTGGTGGPASSTSNATTGGDTWFNTINSAPTSLLGILAKGGGYGGNNGGAAGAGGAIGTGYGSTKYSGGTGGVGGNSGGAGGGSSAGTVAGGATATSGSGTAGATAPTGGGNGGSGSSSTDGSNGTSPGGGGGGSNDAAANKGGNGANGQIVISWTQPVFYYLGSGDPTSTANWKTLAGSTPNNFTDNYQTFIIQAGQTATVTTAGWTISGTGSMLEVQSGGTLTENTAITITTATLQIDNGGTLSHNVNSTSIFGGTLSFGATSTVNYGLGGAQSVYAATYGNLTLSNSGAKALISGISVAGNMTLSGTATTTTVAALTISGNLIIGDGTTFTVGAFALTVSGTTTIGNGGSGKLQITSATGTKTFTGQVTVNAGGTWDNSSTNSAVTIQGGINNNGTFTAGTGVYTFNTNSQSLSGILSIPSVTVTGVTLTNTGTLTVATALAGVGGGLTNTGTLNISGTSTITTLTATATGNIVNYNGAAQTVKAVNYYNLTLSGSGAKTLAAGTTSIGGGLTFSGTASATAAIALTVGGDITLGSGTTFAAGTYTHNLAGNWINNGGTFTVGTPTINLNGTSSQSIGGSASTSFYKLTLNNSNGAVLGIATTVSNTLTLTSGTLALGNYDLTVTGSTSGGSSSAMIATNGTGYLIQNAATSAVSYPIGDGGYYSPVSVTSSATGGTVNLRAVSTTTLGTGYITKYWDAKTSVAGKTITATFTYGASEGGQAIKLVTSTSPSGPWAAPSSGTVTLGSYSATLTGTTSISTTSTYWTIGVPNTYYSYKNGSWNDATTWTSDPSGTTQVGSTVPGNGDNVEILSGRTVTLPANITTTGLNVTIDAGGFIDLSSYQFSAGLATLAGQGTLKLSSAVFPTPITTNTFVNAGGGTVEYNTGVTLPSQATYNNLTINASGATVIQKIAALTLNGNLKVKAGTFQLNDNTAQRLSLTVNGDATVDAGASFKVGTGVTNSTTTTPTGIATTLTPPFVNYFYNNSHTIILKGNFTNNGTVQFTNLAKPLYNAFPPTTVGTTTGFATVYFQGASDNTLTCAGQTDFYNMVVDKGSDQTFKLTLYTSGSYSNFRLFGANTAESNDVTNASASNPNIKKALWIRTGTLELQGTTVIPSLSEGTTSATSYTIPANGALKVNGASVIVQTTADNYQEINAAYGTSETSNTMGLSTATIGGGLILLGKLQVDNGFLSTKESEGIITNSTASGQFILNNGTVDTKQFLALSGAASSFEQNGGTMVLRGRFQLVPSAYTSASNLSSASISTARADAGLTTASGTFSMSNTTNVFTVSGGTMNIYDVCGSTSPGYAFQVGSSSSNIYVTGGTVQFIPTTGTGLADVAVHQVTTTAPLYNVTINRASGTSSIQLASALTVPGNLTLTSGVLNANSNNVSIGGDFSIASGTTYTSGTNTTTFNGSGTQTFTINLASALSLNNLAISKSSGIALNMAGSQTTLNVGGTFNLTAGTLNDNGDVIYVAGNVYNSGLHAGTGKISLNGTSVQTIDGAGIFQNLELNNTNSAAAPVSLVANTTVNGTLNMVSSKIFNIGTYNLAIGSSGAITATAFGNSCYIRSAGNSGDGGITKTYSTTTAFTFPVGCYSTKRTATDAYTPASIGLSSAPTAYGAVTVIPVGYEHPATTVNGQSLAFYWRIKSTGFSGIASGSVTHSFVYSATDLPSGYTWANYIPSLYNRSAYTWNSGLNSNITAPAGTHTISDWSSPTNSTNFLDADYTIGDNTTSGGAFGSPKIYYSRQSGNWSTTSTWSLTSHTVTNVPSTAPGANDIVIIGNGNTVTLTATANSASLQIQSGAILDVATYTGSNFGMVLNHSSGLNGKIRVCQTSASPSLFTFPSGDFTDFNVNKGTTEFYTTTNGASNIYILPSTVTSYGNLILSPNGMDNLSLPNTSLLTIYGDLTFNSTDYNSWIAMSWNTSRVGMFWYSTTLFNPTIEKTVHVLGNLNVNGGTLEFMDDYVAQHLVVDGDVVVANSTNAQIDCKESGWLGGTSAIANTFTIGGSLINNSFATFRQTTKYCDLIFTGSTSASIKNTAGTPTTTLNKVTVNKGTDQTTTLNCSIGGTLSTLTDNWLTLQNGTFQYTRTNPGTDFTISTTTAFNIPSTAGLYINYPSNSNGADILIANGSSNTNDVTLGGKLTVVAGNVYVGPTSGTSSYNNDIEYASAGTPTIEVDGGTLMVNGQIRRNPSIAAGDLSYIQTGGTVTINGNNTNTTNAKLEVLNSGTFTMSSGTLNIIRGGGGATFGDLYLRPGSSSVTGGTIVFDNSSMSGSAQTYLLDANVSLYNLTVTGRSSATTANATAKLMVNPLTLNGDLTLTNAYSIFDANTSNNIDVTLNGNFVNNGTYNYYKNLTTFSGGAQTLSGSSVTNFYDLVVAPVTSLTVNNGNTNTVNNNLTLSNGTLILGSNLLNVKGNLVNNATYTDSNTGIVLNGTSQQQLSGTGTYGQLNLNNSLGAVANSSITMNGNLILTNGILDINQYLLTLGANSIITASGTGFSASKMVTSDGVWSNVGIKKIFSTSPPATFTYPLGVPGKYTPAIVNISANGATGAIRVNNINKHHPAVLDANNVLKYYWEVATTGISGFSGNFVFNYLATDVVVQSPNTECNYYSAKLITPGTNWFKSSGGVDCSNHKLTFNYTSSGDESLTGEYTAGMDAAIPSVVPQYTSNTTGNWSDKTIWTPSGGTTYPCPDGGPNGFVVTIAQNTVVTTDANYCTAYKTYLNGTLKCVSPTYGHNLGSVYGNGTLYMNSDIFPAGRFDAFINCSGTGTLEYGGSGSYNVNAALYSRVPNLTFSGTGSRILPDKNLTICQQLLINGPSLDNSLYNRRLYIEGTMLRSSGSFVSGSGDSAIVTFSGSSAQTISGFNGTNSFNNLEINNSAGLTLTGAIDVTNKLLLTKGVITTSSSNSLTLNNYSTSCVVPSGGSSTSYVDGPLSKMLNQGDPIFTFPVGKKGYGLGNKLSLRATQASSMLWTAEYFNPNAYSSYTSPLTGVNAKEYWSVKSAVDGSSAYVNVGWDSQSYLTPLMTQNGVSDMRVSQYDGTNWVQITSNVNSGSDNYNGSVETASSTTLPYPTGSASTYYTLGCVNTVKPKIRMSPSGALCGGSGIPVTLTGTLAIVSPFTVNYTENGTAKSITPTSFPATITPTSTGGTIVLTGFTYNYPAGNSQSGAFDASSVTVNPVPTTANAGLDQSLCGATSATLAGNNPSVGSGLWTIVSGTGGTITSPTDYNSSFTGTNGSAYTLRWTISSGTGTGACTSYDDVNITFPLLPVQPSSFSASSSTVCQGQSGVTYTVPNDLTASSYTWSYSGSGATYSSNTNSVTIDFNSSATSGTLSVSTNNGCGTSSPLTMGVTVNPSPTAVAGTAVSTCSTSGAVNITAGSSATNNTGVTWSSSGTGSFANSTSLTTCTYTPSAADISAGSVTLTLTATGNAPCGNATSTKTLTITAVPTATIAPVTPATCAGVGLALTATPAGGSGTYSSHAWTGAGSASLSSTIVANPTFTNSTAGTYALTYTVTDNKGCTGTATTSVTINGNPTITPAATAADVCHSASGQNSTLTYSAVANAPTNYTITWNAAAITAGLANVGSTALPASPITVPITGNVAAGTYTGTLMVTNVNSCTSTGVTFTLKINLLPVTGPAYRLPNN